MNSDRFNITMPSVLPSSLLSVILNIKISFIKLCIIIMYYYIIRNDNRPLASCSFFLKALPGLALVHCPTCISPATGLLQTHKILLVYINEIKLYPIWQLYQDNNRNT